MAARKRRGSSEEGWDQSVRDRIQTSMLVNRLTDHVLGKCDLKPTQVQSAQILLSKTLPNLSQAENKTTVTHRYVARVPDKATTAETWQQQHSPEATQH
jgi:hypothetical protein